MESLVVTVVGPDRPGLVSLLSDCGRNYGASWEQSRMASLAGQFAGIVHFAVPPESAEALTRALRQLESMGLNVQVATGAATAASESGSTGSSTLAGVVELELVGQDRPGIVRDISRAIAKLGVSIVELTTEVTSAAMSGEHLFNAAAVLQVPSHVAIADLQRVLEAIANELMVDVQLHAPSAESNSPSGTATRGTSTSRSAG